MLQENKYQKILRCLFVCSLICLSDAQRFDVTSEPETCEPRIEIIYHGEVKDTNRVLLDVDARLDKAIALQNSTENKSILNIMKNKMTKQLNVVDNKSENPKSLCDILRYLSEILTKYQQRNQLNG